MQDGGSVRSGPRVRRWELAAIWAASLVWLLFILMAPAGHMFLRGQSTGRNGWVYLCCWECESAQLYPELPDEDDDGAWVCQNPAHKGRPQDRVAVYPEG
jgi:hypothetical protein